MEIGNQIKAHRQRRGMTQEALADQLGVTAQAVSIGVSIRTSAIFWYGASGMPKPSAITARHFPSCPLPVGAIPSNPSPRFMS